MESLSGWWPGFSTAEWLSDRDIQKGNALPADVPRCRNSRYFSRSRRYRVRVPTGASASITTDGVVTESPEFFQSGPTGITAGVF